MCAMSECGGHGTSVVQLIAISLVSLLLHFEKGNIDLLTVDIFYEKTI